MTKQTVFLIDDDEDDIFLARLAFDDYLPDWKLVSFDDGQALIDHLTVHAGDALPDLIILDLNMPRLNGFETLTLLKRSARWKTVPTAILSTSSNAEDRERSKAIGACTFMVKPASVDRLATLIVKGKAICDADQPNPAITPGVSARLRDAPGRE